VEIAAPLWSPVSLPRHPGLADRLRKPQIVVTDGDRDVARRCALWSVR
jgi:hypothetical protein